MSWSTGGSAASWPAYTTPGGSGLTFRANTDAGLVFLAGYGQNGSGTTVTLNPGAPLPPAFRPLQAVTLNDASGTVPLTIGTDGLLTMGAPSGGQLQARFRDFYFTTVTPG